MMSVGLSLSLPADARYRGLASEVARKFAELMGASPADAKALSTAVAGAIDRAADAVGEGDIRVEFRPGAADVGVTLHWDGRSTELRHPLPARET